MTRPDGDAKTRVNGSTDSAPLLDVSPQVRADVDRRVAQELGVSVLAWSRMVGGAQNRLFRLDTLDGPPLLAKLYVVDRWPRLESEYATLRALNAQHLARVPWALLRDDGMSYAVYSFEPGEMRPAAKLTRRDVEAIAAFTADLLRFGPQDLAGELAPAVDASFSPTGHRRVIHARLAGVETNVDSEQLSGVRAQVDELLGGLVDEADEPLPRGSWRLTTGDFGPHNMLFALDGQLTVVDFEAAGWDDPAHAVMSFVAHAASEDLPPVLSTLFLGEFAELAQLSAADTARYERVGRLMDLEWVAVYASALSADNIANEQSAIPGFSRAAYVAGVIDKLERRLSRAVRGGGYRFPG
jgi:aminoglycoside phosphotransferase (APT) family kinase protein